jgi:hypothetical protein
MLPAGGHELDCEFDLLYARPPRLDIFAGIVGPRFARQTMRK